MEKRFKKLTLFVSPKEQALFSEFAYRQGMSLSSLIRSLVIREIQIEGSSLEPEDQKLGRKKVRRPS
jgi:hypothetical protein